MKELEKLIKPMLKADTDKLLAIRHIISEMKWLVLFTGISSALLILCAALAGFLRTLLMG